MERFGDDATATFDAYTGIVTWQTGAGKTVKSAPAAVRDRHAEQLKEFKAAVKDVEKMLSAQSERLDRQLLGDRTWRFDAWRERFLDHPLVGVLARRLIWLVDDVPCMFADGELRGLDDAVAKGESVRLWHPIGRDVAEVLGWRDRLESRQLQQPFKQAHREVYLLTAAEENTRVYSNRFAAHVLRQHQFHALAARRGWRNQLRLMVDDTYAPATPAAAAVGAAGRVLGGGHRRRLRHGHHRVRRLPAAGHRPGAVLSDRRAGQPRACRRRRLRAVGPRRAPIPPSRCRWPTSRRWCSARCCATSTCSSASASVGNDPTWQDGGPEGRFRDYWTSYSFGELSGTAQTRRDLLARLVPRLAIADRATVDDRFLVVRGDLRTYKIHLGSGNILMSPNDEYLCIVPKQTVKADNGGVFLPFEGDRVLSVILSKALMLAKDTEITDPTITHQIRPAPARAPG